MKKISITFIVYCISALFCSAQAQNTENTNKELSKLGTHTFGLKAALNYTIENGAFITPTAGFSYEWVPKCSGIEIGAYYTNYTSDYEGLRALTHHIQIPIFWKVHTKHLNFALGIQTLWYLGYNINENKSALSFEHVKRENYRKYGNYIANEPSALDVGVALRLGYPIALSSNWSLEPQIGVEYMYEQSFAASVGLVLRMNK